VTTKTPTTQGISALLRKAGFEKSVSHASRVRGWRNHSWGYVVQRGDEEGAVRVYHQTASFRVLDAERQQVTEQQDRYADAIEAAGYAAKRGDGGRFGPVIVRARSEEA
jgi:hypothetical protein